MSQKASPRINPYLIVAIGVIGTSFAAIFVRLATAPFLIIAFYRLLFTVIILSPFFVKMQAWRQLRTLPRKTVLIIIGAGVTLALHFAFWISSLDYTSIASAVIIVDTSAIFAAILGYLFLKERLNWARIIGILIAFFGVCIIAMTDSASGSAFLGDLLALIAAIACGFYLIAGRHVRKEVELVSYVFLLYLTCTLTLFITCIIWRYSFFSYHLNNFLLFLALAIIPTIFGHTLYNWALKFVDASVVGVSLLAEPIGSILLGWLIIGEVPHLLVIVGGLLVLSGIYMTIRLGYRDKVEKLKNDFRQ